MGRQPAAARGSCAPLQMLFSLFHPQFPVPFFLSHAAEHGGHGEEKNAGWGHPQLSCCPTAVPPEGQHLVATTSGIPRASLPISVVITSPSSDFLLFLLGSSTDT